MATVSAAILTLTLTACAGPGDSARDLAEQWLDGDATVQCLGQPARWSSWVLGASTFVEQAVDSELWTVELSGVRNGRPVDSGHVLVELAGDASCVKWSQP